MTSLNACPICGLTMYSLDRTLEIACEGLGTLGEALTREHFELVRLKAKHAGHAHLVDEVGPGVYVKVGGNGSPV